MPRSYPAEGLEALLRDASPEARAAAEIVYDATAAFCRRFVPRSSRTHDQMVQAGRNGKQNIIEASAAAGMSSRTELRLVGVTRASLEELLADYRGFLLERDLPQWSKDGSRAQETRRLSYVEDRCCLAHRSYFEHPSPDVAANAAIRLVCQAAFLLVRLQKCLEQDSLEHGGVSEHMLAARLRHRGHAAPQHPTPRSPCPEQ